MRRYSEAAGHEVSREAFVRGILQPGPPHPYRKIWLDVSRETLLEAARAIHDAVRAVSPTVPIGLMSSVPYVHAAEGRDWPKLLHALSGGAVPVSRVHLPAYQEMVPSSYQRRFNMVSMQCAAMLPRPCDIYPELENYPYSLFSKSRRFTRFQLLSSLPLDLSGMTIDLFDLNGNGLVFSEGYQHALREVKPFLNATQALGVFSLPKEGVRVLYSPKASYFLHTARGESMEELYPQEVFFAGLLGDFGIPFAYTDDIHLSGCTVAVSGQAFRGFEKEDIAALFQANAVLLDGDAAETLCDMGLGALAGIQGVRWLKQNGGEHTYEQVTNGLAYHEHESARASSVISCSDVLDVTPLPEAAVSEYSAFYNAFRRRACRGEAVINGRVILFPFGHFEGPAAIPPMLLNSVRQALMQDMLRAVGFASPMVTGTPHLFPYSYRQGDTAWLYLVNAGLDDLEAVTLSVRGGVRTVTVRASGAPEARAAAFTRDGDRLTVDIRLPAMEAALLALILFPI